MARDAEDAPNAELMVLQEIGFSAVKDARFKGAFITRHYGQSERAADTSAYRIVTVFPN